MPPVFFVQSVAHGDAECADRNRLILTPKGGLVRSGGGIGAPRLPMARAPLVAKILIPVLEVDRAWAA